MKKYLLFAGDNYYPDGGLLDYKGDFDTVEDAIEWARKNYKKIGNEGLVQKKYIDQWGHVVRSVDMSIVREWSRSGDVFRFYDGDKFIEEMVLQ